MDNQDNQDEMAPLELPAQPVVLEPLEPQVLLVVWEPQGTPDRQEPQASQEGPAAQELASSQ